ncbi:hypothetical protein GCM10008090_01680 [Arenicella chitinivorans]|uniref:Uncharacterized protein n=2 Tax=Arenicella chitinivorans TaxID=1329800 RepID=A0A918RHU2_9GAMM|nr:hypothetical protein GCM10008090_01680 [Arenicella chitinivorans]
MQTPIKVILLSVFVIGVIAAGMWLLPNSVKTMPQNQPDAEAANTETSDASNPFVSQSGQISPQMLEFMVRDVSAKLRDELLTVFADDTTTATQIATLAEQKIRRDVELLSSMSNSQPWSLVNNTTAQQARVQDQTALETNRVRFEHALTAVLNAEQQQRFRAFERQRAEPVYRNSATLFALKLNIGVGGLSDDQVMAVNQASVELLGAALDTLPIGTTIGQQLLADKQRIPALMRFRNATYNVLTAEQKARFADSLASSLIN